MVNNPKPSANSLSASEITAIVKKIAAGVIEDVELAGHSPALLSVETSRLLRTYPWSVIGDSLGFFNITLTPMGSLYYGKVQLILN